MWSGEEAYCSDVDPLNTNISIGVQSVGVVPSWSFTMVTRDSAGSPVGTGSDACTMHRTAFNGVAEAPTLAATGVHTLNGNYTLTFANTLAGIYSFDVKVKTRVAEAQQLSSQR